MQRPHSNERARRALTLCASCILLARNAAAEVSEVATRQELFARVFGAAVELDPARHREVLEAAPGTRLYVPAAGPGAPAEVWFVDTDSRHPAAFRPVLVRAIDEDGDLAPDAQPDHDSDLYVADWKADGTVDAVLDYTDTDRDGDVDEMGIFFTGELPYFDGPVLRVWWGRDVGDDNLLWYDVGYAYDQALCQYRTHFGGDEMFVAFALPAAGPEWIPCFENPFLFYDHDGDGVTEEVLRVSGLAEDVESIRHSFDADGDATPERPRDFDLSITAWAPGAHWTGAGRARGRSELELDPRFTVRATIRGVPTGPFLRHESAAAFVTPVTWARTLLTWDEIDHNVDGQRFDDAEERWEGVIAHGCADFPQVGGPSAGPLNKRYELDLTPAGPTRLYLHPCDGRTHLHGADRAWTEVDLDFDRIADLRYAMSDEDRDGFLDTWSLDLGADGTADDTWRSGAAPEVLPDLEWSRIRAVCGAALHTRAAGLTALNAALEQAIARSPGPGNAFPALRLFDPAAPSSAEARRFTESVNGDIMMAELRRRSGPSSFWPAFAAARGRGDLAAMVRLLQAEFGAAGPAGSAETGAAVPAPSQPLPPTTAWAEDWVPPNIGWESDRIAYRMYWGQFDFFGKKRPCLIYPTIGAASYHEETDWGIDALLVGDSPGCGGVTLYVDGKPCAAWAPNGQGSLRFEKRLVAAREGQVVVEVIARGVGPPDSPCTLRWRCTALAGRSDSPIELLIEGGEPGARIEAGVGVTRLPEESLLLDSAAGVLALWGEQTPAIGPIGMGILFPPERFQRVVTLPNEHQVVLAAEPGVPLLYHIRCDWLRGRRFPCCPTAADWLETLQATAARVRMPAIRTRPVEAEEGVHVP